MARIWAGVDIGKTHHHCVAVDAEGAKLLSRRLANDEPEILALLADILALGEEVTWAVDVADGMAALLLGILFDHGQSVVYMPGLAVNRAASSYRGVGKTDARDAHVIADQARMRRDLTVVKRDNDQAVELRILTERRADLVTRRTRQINRLRGMLASIFPALEQGLELGNVGPLVLLTGYQTPGDLRSVGCDVLEGWLRDRHVRNAAGLAAAASAAAERQYTAVPGQRAIARMIATLAAELVALNAQVYEMDKLISETVAKHKAAEVVASMPGFGPLLSAEFLGATNGDMARFGTADRLASFAGVAPVPRDSGSVSGNLHRPRRYHRGLQRVFYTAALNSIRHCEQSRSFYDRKRAEGKHHTQAVLALARRRVNVLWALLRDDRCFSHQFSLTTAA